MDIYSDYLISNAGYSTATGLSKIFTNISHDQITYLLNSKEYSSKTLFKIVKPLIRDIENEENGVLIIDDTISEKPYTDINEINQYFHSGLKNDTVKGINIITALLSYKNKEYVIKENSNNDDKYINIPVDYKIVKKDIEYIDEEGKTKYRSSISKNALFREMIGNSINKKLIYSHILADSWYCNVDNIKYLYSKKKLFILGIPTSRNVYFSIDDIHNNNPQKIKSIFNDDTNEKIVYLKNVRFSLKLIKYESPSKDGNIKTIFLITNDLSHSAKKLCDIYAKRWKVEEYHKSIKNNTALSKSPTKKVKSQSNHIFASLLAFCKLEKLKIKTKMNHYAIKDNLLTTANKIIQGLLKQLIGKDRITVSV
jgi:hypothetical protein